MIVPALKFIVALISERSLFAVARPSVVCNVRASYSGG